MIAIGVASEAALQPQRAVAKAYATAATPSGAIMHSAGVAATTRAEGSGTLLRKETQGGQTAAVLLRRAWPTLVPVMPVVNATSSTTLPAHWQGVKGATEAAIERDDATAPQLVGAERPSSVRTLRFVIAAFLALVGLMFGLTTMWSCIQRRRGGEIERLRGRETRQRSLIGPLGSPALIRSSSASSGSIGRAASAAASRGEKMSSEEVAPARSSIVRRSESLGALAEPNQKQQGEAAQEGEVLARTTTGYGARRAQRQNDAANAPHMHVMASVAALVTNRDVGEPVRSGYSARRTNPSAASEGEASTQPAEGATNQDVEEPVRSNYSARRANPSSASSESAPLRFKAMANMAAMATNRDVGEPIKSTYSSRREKKMAGREGGGTGDDAGDGLEDASLDLRGIAASADY